MRIFRFVKIVFTVIRFGLDEVMLSRIENPRVKLCCASRRSAGVSPIRPRCGCGARSRASGRSS